MVNKGQTSCSESPLLEFFVISDYQLSVNNEKALRKLKLALKDLKKINPQPDALVVNGDITVDGKNESYKLAKEIMQEYFYPENTMFTIGNHEFFNSDGNGPSIERFLNFAQRDFVYGERVVGGYPFILLGSESWGPIDSPIKDSAVLSDSQLIWLEETIQKYKSENKPIFVFLHQPLPNSVAGTDLPYYRNGVVQDREINKLLIEYPNVILFSGHSHWDLHLPGQFVQKPFGMVNSGAIYDTYGTDGKGHEIVIDPEGSQGLLVQVYHEKVIIKPRDIAKQRWINQTFEVKLK
ncbi:metallophosphoesterase family protein [Bacillus sp. FSL K6-3431]|uniref:metallophosphoesterase family protein n=1 Tax=Bacillus sp. FSL K6-3431 TaxID=2921500 RepID=UPI0030F7C74E